MPRYGCINERRNQLHEVIRLSGYTEDEKLNIAKRHLLTKQIERNGLKEKEIEIGIEIPAHEQKQVQISGNDRTVKLSMTRHFEGRLEDPTTKGVSESHRTETYYNEFSVPDIIDARTVKKRYEDGMLIFTMAKK